MKRRSFLITTVAGMLAASLGFAPAQAGEATNLHDGVALKGYDPVAYFTAHKPVKGDPTISAEYQGAIYHFASAANRDQFKKDPGHYAPQFGGFCAYGVAQGVKVDIDPAAFTVRDGKLYVNYDADVQKLFKKDEKGFISTANRNWTKLRDAP